MYGRARNERLARRDALRRVLRVLKPGTHVDVVLIDVDHRGAVASVA
jgi:hypothetical protein